MGRIKAQTANTDNNRNRVNIKSIEKDKYGT